MPGTEASVRAAQCKLCDSPVSATEKVLLPQKKWNASLNLAKANSLLSSCSMQPDDKAWISSHSLSS